jgi:hypothetical protein
LRVLAAAAACLIISTGLAGEATLQVTSPENLKGSAAKVTSVIQANGSKVLTLAMTLKSANGAITVLQESVYAPDGRPLRHTRRTSLSSGKLVEFIRADIGSSELKVTVERDGKPVVNKMKLPTGELKAVSEFWIIRDKPTAGAKHTFLRFDLTTLSFSKTTAVYKGLLPLTLSGKQTKAHVIVEGDATTWLDERGDPMKVSGKSSSMERKG